MRWAALGISLLAAASAWAESPTLVLSHPDGSASHHVEVEVVMDDATRARGLMHRQSLCEGCGMVFLYPETGREGATIRMWMKNTLIPLDMIFIRGNQVNHVHADAVPHDETVIASPPATHAVLEVPGGWAAARGITAGWKVRWQQPSAVLPAVRGLPAAAE